MKAALLAAALVLLVATGVHFLVVRPFLRGSLVERQLTFSEDAPVQVFEVLAEKPAPDPSFEDLSAPEPFEDAHLLDEQADSWSNVFSNFGEGFAVFDADGDSRPDLYFTHDGRNWTRPTDAKGVLGDKPRFEHNVLYLNRGNDPAGRPIFKRIDELVRSGDPNAEAKLLIENFLFPRKSVDDSIERPGRKSTTALAVDLDNDGRPELYVGNEAEQMMWSDPMTRRIMGQFVVPVGREARFSKVPLAGLGTFLINYTPTMGMYEQWESARGKEVQGANSLFLNLGVDSDGLPMWKDVSREAGVEGKRSTFGLAAADIDLDGDLDLYVANTPDMDYWPGESVKWAGALNELFVNELAQTGKLHFTERAREMNIDELHTEASPIAYKYRLRQIPLLPVEYSMLFLKLEPYRPEYLVINGKEAEHAEISWATLFQDVDDDGYPDLWVGNDDSDLRLHLNRGGTRFEDGKHARDGVAGSWMSFSAADFDGDLKEDLFVGNVGGGAWNHVYVIPDPFRVVNPAMTESLAWMQFFLGKFDTTHVLLNGADPRQPLAHRIRHSSILPPETSLKNNYRKYVPEIPHLKFDTKPPAFDQSSIAPYEFVWGSVALDVQNDGRSDLYFHGGLFGRAGGLFAVLGTNPGRLLVNATKKPGETRFIDQTAEHHLFDIEELDYDRMETDGYIYRKSPAQNWRKRDIVYSYDHSVWTAQGPGILEHVTNSDLMQASEFGRGVAAADLNGDGYDDLIITNEGGYDSRRSNATNLKAMIDGRPQVVPAPDYNYYSLTNYEPGRTHTFLNRHHGNHWLRIRLIDDAPGSFNRDAIMARVTVDDRWMRIKRAGDGTLANTSLDLGFGLGQGSAHTVEVRWPDRARTVTRFAVDGLRDGTLIISKTKGVVRFASGAVVAR
jgi:VCBS repeat protein/FG-GAP repeat protein/ASPIC/UnbV protein